MSCFTQYKLKDGRKIRGRYEQKSTKVCISRLDLEGLIHEADVAYEQAKQLQTIIENLAEIKRQAITNVLDEIATEFISLYPKNYAGEPELGGASCVFSLDKVLDIIDKHRVGSEDNNADSN